MAQPPIHQRRFTDAEVSEILKRATDDDSPRALSGSEGMSLVELQEIGKEVGIDPARLEDAAREIVLNQDAGSEPIAGIPTVIRYERVVDRELDSANMAAILSTIRRIMGHHGEVSEVSGSFEWRTKGGSVQRLVSISTNAGRTTIEGSVNLRQATVGAYISGGLIAVMIASLGAVLSVGETSLSVGWLGFSAGVLATSYFGLRARVRKRFRSESEKLEKAVTELAELITGASD